MNGQSAVCGAPKQAGHACENMAFLSQCELPLRSRLGLTGPQLYHRPQKKQVPTDEAHHLAGWPLVQESEAPTD